MVNINKLMIGIAVYITLWFIPVVNIAFATLHVICALLIYIGHKTELKQQGQAKVQENIKYLKELGS